MDTSNVLAKFVLAASVAVSIGWCLAAGAVGLAEYGDRGGAIAVAISFAYLFLYRTTLAVDTNAIKRALAAAPTAPVTDEPSDQSNDENTLNYCMRQVTANSIMLAKIQNNIRLLDENSRLQNIYLSLSATIGTVFWAFGDLIAGFVF